LIRAAVVGAAACGLALAGIVGVSEFRLRDYDLPSPFTATIPRDSGSVARGKHLARTRGCFGCHGQRLEGRVFAEWTWVRRAVAPNLAQFARTYDAQTVANAVRWGVGHDGRALWSMPSYNFRHLPDSDVAAIIAFLRSAPAVEQALPRSSLGLRTRWWMARGSETHMAEWAAAVPPLIVALEKAR